MLRFLDGENGGGRIDATELKRCFTDHAQLVWHTSPLDWAKFFVPHWVPQAYAPMHYEMIRAERDDDRSILAAPRNHAKTTLTMGVSTLHEALEHSTGEAQILIGANESMASDWVRKIKRELESNEKLRWYYGKQETSKWTETLLELKNGDIIKAVGRGGVVRGHRAKRVKIDDVEDEESVRSSDLTDHLQEWILTSVLNVLGSTGKLSLRGTVLSITSMLARFLKNPPMGWQTALYAEPDDPQTAEDAAFLWPHHWPRQALIRRKQEIGTLQYLQEMCNNPMPDSIAIFKEPWMQTYESLPLPESEMQWYGGMDLGCRKHEVNDESAFVIYAIAPHGPAEGNIYLVDCAKGRWSLYELIDELLLRQKRWPDIHWGIETVQFQYAMLEVFQQEAQRAGLPYVGMDDWQVKQDKVLRARPSTVPFEQGRVFVRPTHREFVDELLMFPQGVHEDYVDASSMAFFTIQKHYYAMKPKVSSEVSEVHNRLQSRVLEYVKLKERYPIATPTQLWNEVRSWH